MSARIILAMAAVLAVGGVESAQARGCLKGAAVGGVAGHYAGRHAVLGAAAGCVVGRHAASKQDRAQRRSQAADNGQSQTRR